MRKPLPTLVLVALAALGALTSKGPRAHADEPASGPAEGTVRMQADVDVEPTGNVQMQIAMGFNSSNYAVVKARAPDPRKFLQDLLPNRADFEVAEASAQYEDASSSVVLKVHFLGLATDKGDGLWELPPERAYEFVKSSAADAPRPVAYFKEAGEWDNGVKYTGEYAYTLPAGSSEARWDGDRHVLSWRLRTEPGQGEPQLDVDLRVRERLMSTIYKVYGLGSDFAGFWVAKTVFKNRGPSVVRNLKVRYRLQGYNEWSPWDKFPEVVPGQTVVSVHYPVLDASIAKLRSNTAANLLMEYVFTDASGKKREEDDAKKVVILGVNEFVFGNLMAGQSFGSWQEESNNAPLLAAWVTRNDGAVKQFAAMANKNAGGVGGSSSDEAATAVLKACYDLLRLNDFSYQHPPGLSEKSVSFDVKGVQNVKFPRDTIRDRSGTCIDLAILYAAMANAVGLEPHLALIPGHCFPVIKMPGGSLVGVETTGVSGGLRFGSAPFEKVFEIGTKELEDAVKDGRIHLIDVRSLWTRGMANPELEELPADVLQRWGVNEEGKAGGAPGAAPGPAAGPEAPRTDGASKVVGLWGGRVEAKLEGGTIHTMVIGIDNTGENTYRAGMMLEVTVDTPNGGIPVTVVGQYEGTSEGDTVFLKATRKTRKVGPQGREEDIPLDAIVAKFDGSRLSGKVGSDAEGWQTFNLAPKKD